MYMYMYMYSVSAWRKRLVLVHKKKILSRNMPIQSITAIKLSLFTARFHFVLLDFSSLVKLSFGF